MEIIIAFIIHFVVPAAGVAAYLSLCKWIKTNQIPDPPYISLFILFALYGSWLLIGLTSLFWYWSGMATIGLFFLVLVAPIIMIVLTIITFRQRKLSNIHFATFIASGIYILGSISIMIFFFFPRHI